MVSSGSMNWASRIEAAVWVAPTSLAFSSLKGTGSTAMMVRAPAMRAPWIGARADATAPDDDHGLAGLDLGPVHRRSEAGGDAATDEGGRLHVGVGLDAHHRVLVADHLVGEGPQLRHAVEVLAAQVVAVGAVTDHAAGQGGHAEVAQVLAPRGAPVADATRGDEGHGHVVAHADLGHVGPGLGDDARALVTAHHGEHRLHADHLEHFGRQR